MRAFELDRRCINILSHATLSGLNADYQPLHAGATPDMRVFREEVFGPVTPVFKFGSEDGALLVPSSVLAAAGEGPTCVAAGREGRWRHLPGSACLLVYMCGTWCGWCCACLLTYYAAASRSASGTVLPCTFWLPHTLD